MSLENDVIYKNNNFKQVTASISSETNFLKLLKENFSNEEEYKYGIVGLHTCGSLSNDSIKLFIKNKENAAFLLNVGCCYHFLQESFDQETPSTFPMSSYLRTRKFKLGRNARMLSLQPKFGSLRYVSKICQTCNSNTPSKEVQ